MPTDGQEVKIAHYTRSKFNSLTNKDSATIYYVEEPDGKIKQYIGNTHVVSDLGTATTSVNGLMSSVDKTKLNGIASGAQVNVATNLSQGARSTTTLRIDSSTGSNLTIPAATTSLAGLMTSTDKTRLDVLHSLLEEDTENNVVDSINEVLEIFNNYPEGADLVSALAGKVDKVEGKGLSTNDFTTTLKNKLDGISAGATTNTGTVTNVSSGTQINGMTMLITDGITAPVISTAISSQANFRSAIGAGTSNLTIGTTASTAKAGNYHPTWSQVTSKPSFATVATSGSYNDLTNKPSIPAAQVQSNWNATTGMGVILNKPNLATVATSGSYNDLTNKPTIPSIPSVMNTTEGNTGTSTIQRTINAANLKSIILNHSPAGTVTNVSAGSQVNGLTLSVATGSTTPVITTSINDPAKFRTAIGAGTSNFSGDYNYLTNKLTAGTNITIENNVISATAAGSDYSLTKSKIEAALVGTTTYSIQLGNEASAAGHSSVAIGASASTTIGNSIALGNETSTSAGESAALGWRSKSEGRYSTALGILATASGEGSTAIGRSVTASATSSTALGKSTNATGNSSSALGDSATASGAGSIAIGSSATSSQNSSIAIGGGSNAAGMSATAIGPSASAGGRYSTALGRGATAGTTQNLMQLGNTSLAILNSQVALTVTSDIRDKADIEEVPKALDFIKDLNPITYVSNDRDHYISEEQKETETYRNYLMVEDYDRESHSQGTKKGERRRVGLSAQEVRDKLIEHYGSDNYANVVNDNFVEFEERELDIPEGLENKLTMSYETLVPFLIKAIQEQQEQIEELKQKINSDL